MRFQPSISARAWKSPIYACLSLFEPFLLYRMRPGKESQKGQEYIRSVLFQTQGRLKSNAETLWRYIKLTTLIYLPP